MSPFIPTCSTSSLRTIFMRLRPRSCGSDPSALERAQTTDPRSGPPGSPPSSALQRAGNAPLTVRAFGSAPGSSFFAFTVGRDRRLDLAVGLGPLEVLDLLDRLGAVLELLLRAVGRHR